MKNILIFASGNGSNADQLIRYFAHSKVAQVGLVISDRKHAPVLSRAKNYGIPYLYIPHSQLNSPHIMEQFATWAPFHLTVLAGFLSLFPVQLIKAFNGNVINLHPALLPKFGGKGMYGHHVHEAVISAKEEYSGITIHWVNEAFDQGTPLFQATCRVAPQDTPDTLAERIHALEHYFLPRVCHTLLAPERFNPFHITRLTP